MKMTLEQKVNKKATKYIGQYIRIRTSKTSTVGGTVVKCQYGGSRKTNSSEIGIFDVTLESGTKKIVTTHKVEKMPKMVS